MKKQLFFLAVLGLLVTSCKKESSQHSTPVHLVYGCTDSVALNYTDTANRDNGTCSYLADLFNGTYVAYDSTRISSTQAPTYTGADTFTFSLYRFRHDTVKLCNFVCPNDTAYFKADSTELYFGAAYCIVWGTYRFKLSHDTLYYSSYAWGQGYYGDVWNWGYAVRQ